MTGKISGQTDRSGVFLGHFPQVHDFEEIVHDTSGIASGRDGTGHRKSEVKFGFLSGVNGFWHIRECLGNCWFISRGRKVYFFSIAIKPNEIFGGFYGKSGGISGISGACKKRTPPKRGFSCCFHSAVVSRCQRDDMSCGITQQRSRLQ
jgi:hypothetical protein